MLLLLLSFLQLSHALPAAYECPVLLPATDAPNASCATAFATVLGSRWYNNTRSLSARYMLDCTGGDTVARLVEGLSASACLVPSPFDTRSAKRCERALTDASQAYVTATLGQQRVVNVYVVQAQELVSALALELMEEGPVVSYDGAQCLVVQGWLANESWVVRYANGTRNSVPVAGSMLQHQWWAWRVQRQVHEPIDTGRAPLQVLFLTAFSTLLLLVLFSSCDCCPLQKKIRLRGRHRKKHGVAFEPLLESIQEHPDAA